MTITVEFQPTSSWKHDFRRLEMQFFDIDEGQWNPSKYRKLEELHPNYVAAVHELHVKWLNQGLPLVIDLQAGAFNGEIELIRLRDEVVAPLVAVAKPFSLTLDDDLDFAELGLDHLT